MRQHRHMLMSPFLAAKNIINLISVSTIWLKAQHSENEDHGIWYHHFTQYRRRRFNP